MDACRSDRVLISTPQFAWEKHGLPINEGPEALIHNGTAEHHLFGQRILDQSICAWPADVQRYRLDTRPLVVDKSLAARVSSDQSGTGVGHASFTNRLMATENWIVYHAHANPTTFNEDRVIRIQSFTLQ